MIIVPIFSQFVKPLQHLVEKYVYLKLSEEQRNSFVEIRKDIAEAPTLMSPYFNKYFILYTFATNFSYVADLIEES